MHRIVFAAIVIVCLLALVGCGDDDSAPAVTPSPVPTGPGGKELCTLLSTGDVEALTGQAVTRVEPYDSGTVDSFCTYYLDIPQCDPECTLAFNNLGEPRDSTGASPDIFRQGFIDLNADGEVSFEEDVVGDSSWLGVTQGGVFSGQRMLYFQHGGVAYALAGPVGDDHGFSSEQMIAMAQSVLAKLGTPAPS